jgi:hypothetical protein
MGQGEGHGGEAAGKATNDRDPRPKVGVIGESGAEGRRRVKTPWRTKEGIKDATN